jgi:hypothetical protein
MVLAPEKKVAAKKDAPKEPKAAPADAPAPEAAVEASTGDLRPTTPADVVRPASGHRHPTRRILRQDDGPACTAATCTSPATVRFDPRRNVRRRRRTRPMPKMKTSKTAAKRFKQDRDGQAPPPPAEPPAPVREEALDAHASSGRRWSTCTRATRRRSSASSASADPDRVTPHTNDPGVPARRRPRHPHTNETNERGREQWHASSARVAAKKSHKAGPGAGEGLLRQQEPFVPRRERAGAAQWPVRVPRPPGEEGRVPSSLDPADQRRRAVCTRTRSATAGSSPG